MGLTIPKAQFMQNIEIPESGVGTVVVGAGILILILALCGCATCKFKKVCFAIPFGILSGVIGLVLFIVGFIVLGFAQPLVDEIMTKVCATGAVVSLASEYNTAVSKWVCSASCPCPLGDGSTKTLWESYGNEFFSPFSRAKNYNSMSSTQKSEYDTYSDYATVSPLVFLDEATATTYTTWE